MVEPWVEFGISIRIAILSPTYACLYAMQHGICKALLFSTLQPQPQLLETRHHSETHGHGSNVQTKNPPPIEELVRVIVFTAASLSIMGFPFLTGLLQKLGKGRSSLRSKNNLYNCSVVNINSLRKTNF